MKNENWNKKRDEETQDDIDAIKDFAKDIDESFDNNDQMKSKSLEEFSREALISFNKYRVELDEKLANNEIKDMFAAKVLQGITAGFYSLDYAHGWSHEEIAKECYDIAEAMIAERSKRNG